MTKLIIIAGLLFSHSVFAASKGREHLKQFFSCDTAMRSGLSPERAALFANAKRLFEKYELVAMVMTGDIQERMRLSEGTFMASLRSVVTRINDVRDNTPAEKLQAELAELEGTIDQSMTPVERNLVSYRFSAAGKAKMETRHFDEDWSDLDRPAPAPQQQQQQQQMRPLNPTPPLPPNYGGWDFGGGFRPDWPPREKK